MGLFVDTNVLLLLFIGRIDETLIERFKRTREVFTVDDYRLLRDYIGKFDHMFTTPQVLAEINSFANFLPGNVRERAMKSFADLITILDEKYQPSRKIALDTEFRRLGLTDASILVAAAERFLVLTDDFRLSSVLSAHGVDVINFNHLRRLLLD